jgi:hypothetical protein
METTNEHHWLCRSNVESDIRENVETDQGAEAANEA